MAYAVAHPETVRTLILRAVFLCRRADVDYFFQGKAADFVLDPLGMSAPGPYLDFPAAWERFVTQIPPEDRDEGSQSQPNHKYALMAGRILIH